MRTTQNYFKAIKNYILLIFGILLCTLFILNEYIIYGLFALIIFIILNYIRIKVLSRLYESENQNKNLLNEIRELKSSKLNVLDIKDILEIGLLEVNTKLTRVWNNQFEEDNKTLNFIGALDINLSVKIGLDLTKVKIEENDSEIIISNTHPHIISFGDLDYTWKISELLELKSPLLGSSHWRKSNDLIEKCNTIKEVYQKEVHIQIKNGPEELNWIIKPLHEKIEKILTSKYDRSNKKILFASENVINPKPS